MPKGVRNQLAGDSICLSIKIITVINWSTLALFKFMNLSKKKFPGKWCQCSDKAQCRQRMAQMAKGNIVTISVMATRQQSRGQGLTMAQPQQQAVSGGLKENGRIMLGPWHCKNRLETKKDAVVLGSSKGWWRWKNTGVCLHYVPLCVLFFLMLWPRKLYLWALTSRKWKSIILSISYYCRKCKHRVLLLESINFIGN